VSIDQYLAVIADRDPDIEAWDWFDPEQARASAAAMREGSLAGVLVGIKDIFDTADMPTQYGSPIYAGHQPAIDAACVTALKNAGAVIMGKTSTTEFAASNPTKTKNPHDLARTPGGSSSGSAAAVAAGMVPAALGTQTAGSIIRPASFCGVVGYKPTYNLVNRAGLKSFSDYTDTIGVLACDVDLAGRVVATMADRPALIETPEPESVHLAICLPPHWERAEPASLSALSEARAILKAAGAQVSDVSLPEECQDARAIGLRIQHHEARHTFAPEMSLSPDLISPILRGVIESGYVIDADSYEEAKTQAVRARAHIGPLFGQFDAVLTLSSPGEAPVGLETTGSPIFNHIWTRLYLPCINLPGLTGPAGMPVGVQLVCARGDDAKLLAIARWAERGLRRATR
jgi:Asp-tRNA(Asn)/Glu-tRNA(Gln) amidotransferase A subunit family amidase